MNQVMRKRVIDDPVFHCLPTTISLTRYGNYSVKCTVNFLLHTKFCELPECKQHKKINNLVVICRLFKF